MTDRQRVDRRVDLDELERFCAAATPGPWRVSQFGHDLSLVNLVDGVIDREVIALDDASAADAAYIAAFAPDTGVALVAVARALEQALDRMETTFNLMHPGDLTDEERHGMAQNMWFGMEEARAALDKSGSGDD